MLTYEPKEQSDYVRQLQSYQQKISNILESFRDAFFEADKNWIPRQGIVGKNLWNIYKKAISLKSYAAYYSAMREHVTLIPSDDGLSVYFKDITARKSASDQLEMEKQKYQDLFNFSPIPQWVYDFETLAFLQVNEAAITQYGYSRDEFLKMTIKDIRPAEELVALEEIISNIVKTGGYNQSAVKHLKKNGAVIFVLVQGNTVSFEGRNARLVLAIDHTEKIKAQQELELSLNRYDIVSEATSDAIWDWDIETGTLTWNKGIKAIFGHDDVDFNYEWWESNVHPDDLAHVLNRFNELSRSQHPRQQVEYRFRCADGNYKTVLDRSFILFDTEGNAIRMIGSMQDITDRIRDMQAIEAHNKRLLEISWLQSHKVRAPLARILGLAALMDMQDCGNILEIKKLIGLIRDSANDLDSVIKEISNKTQLPDRMPQ